MYSVIHTYPGAGAYIIKSIDFNRRPGLRNIQNSGNVAFYLDAMLVINSSLGINSSPVLTNPPVTQATVGVCFYHDVGAVDAENDSLSYELSVCKDHTGQMAPGYFFPEANNSFSINPVTGILSWCTPQWLDTYAIGIIVKEWRKNGSGVYQLMGYVFRDMEVIVNFGVVGIHGNTADESMKIYPNPFSEKLEIDIREGDEPTEVFIYANDGRPLLKGAGERAEGKLTLATEALEPGLYLLQIKTARGSLYKKMIRE